MRVTTGTGVIVQRFGVDPDWRRVMERLVDLAAVVPKEATWEGTMWKRRER